MKKQILTGLAVMLLGSSMAFASPQSFRSDSNGQYQPQQWQRDQRNVRQSDGDRYSQRDERVSERSRNHDRQRLERARYEYSRARHRSHQDDDWRR